MRARHIAFLILIAHAVAVHAVELAPQDFAYAMQLETPDKAAVYRVSLPIEVYRNAVRGDLGDLRVFNARGEVVPYALKRPPGAATQRQPERQLRLFPLKDDSPAALDAVRVTIESGKAAVNVQTQSTAAARQAVLSYLVDGRALEVPVTALLLDWPADAAEFAGRLRVEASDDLGSWRNVIDAAPIANLHSDSGLLIERRAEFAATRAKFWRLSWAGGAPSFVLTGVRAEPAAGPVDMKRSLLTAQGSPISDRPGEFVFDLGARLPADRINLELPDHNSIVQVELQSRAGADDPWQSAGQHGFYRLETRNGEMLNGDIAVAPDSNRYWRVKIDQHGGGLGGSGIPRLKAGWISDEVIFVARGAGPFQLAYGSAVAERSEAPLTAIPRDVPIAQANLSAQRELGGAVRLQPPKPPFPWKTAVLWTVLALGVAFLAWMAYRLSKQL